MPTPASSTPAPAQSSASDANVQHLIDKTRNAHDRSAKKVDEAVQKIKSAVSSIPDFLLPSFIKSAINAGITKIYNLFQKISDKLIKYFNSPGWPGALWEASEQWVNGVAKPCADTEERVNESHFHVDEYWKGSAARSYKDTLPEQQAAFAAMTQVARKLHQACDDSAWNIIKLWAGLVVTVLGLAAAVAGFVASATGVGAILGVPTLVAGIVGCIAGIAAITWTVTQGFHAIGETISSLKNEVQLNTSFNGDKWPRAAATGTWKAD